MHSGQLLNSVLKYCVDITTVGGRGRDSCAGSVCDGRDTLVKSMN